MTQINRRNFISMAGTMVLVATIPECASVKGATNMYGLIGKMHVVPGKRDALIAILIEGVERSQGRHA
jgi:hypothetical protein